MKKIFLTGIKPTGRIHLGNYFSAVKPILEAQERGDYEIYLFIADLHSLTSEDIQKDKNKLRNHSRDLLLDLLAVGIDPKKITLYRQSDFPQITELAWLFNCITTLSRAKRAHAFKNNPKEDEVNIGLLSYPMLMASDILLPNSNLVPVGKDQQQHLEMARDLAEKFNSNYGEYFIMPEGVFQEEKEILGTDGRKMSKSYSNTIELMASEDDIRKVTSKIVTDSRDKGDTKEENELTAIYRLFTDDESKINELKNGGMGYGDFKKALADLIIDYTSDFRTERAKLENMDDIEESTFSISRGKLNKIFDERLKEIKSKIGLI